MGVFNFARDIGEKIFHRNKDKQPTTPAAQSAAVQASPQTPSVAAQPQAAGEPSAQEIANLLLARIQAQNIKIDQLSVSYNSVNDTVTLTGQAYSQADRERARLAVGNVQYVATVVDDLTVATPEPESQFYTVKAGDTLSKIAKNFYGNANAYMQIFEANKPMLSDPNKIYVGQVLRIPTQK